jgi:hypothetical protein
VDSVSLARGAPAPTGTRSADPTVVGQLVVVFGSSAALLQSVIGVLKAWRDRHRPRTVEFDVEIEGHRHRIKLSDATEAEQQQLVSALIRSIPGQQ